MLKNLFRLGITPELNSYLRVKVILSNQIAMIMGIVDIIYGILSWLYFRDLLLIYIIGLLLMSLVYVLNTLQLYSISRFFTAIFPFLISFSTYLAFLQPSGNAYLEIMLVSFSMMFCPFIVFDNRELILRNFSYLICAVLLVFYKPLNSWINIVINAPLLQNETFLLLNLVLSVVVMFAYLAVLQSTTYRSELKNRQLIEEMEKNSNEALKKGEMLEITLQEVEKSRIEEEKRTWAANGLAMFSVLLREEGDDLNDKLISQLVKYVEANQGSLFVLEGEEADDKYLKLEACYAYDKKKYIEKRIDIGKGLVGQCYLEKQRIFLKTVPDNYVHITSGLGEANPTCILIVPMLMNEEVEGVIEIASFQVMQSHQIEFIEKVSESLASVLRNNKINRQTRYLLEESREQAEEMRAAEEEMRQNMEELQATQEEMYRKEQEYLEIIDGLRHENELLKNEIKKMTSNF